MPIYHSPPVAQRSFTEFSFLLNERLTHRTQRIEQSERNACWFIFTIFAGQVGRAERDWLLI